MSKVTLGQVNKQALADADKFIAKHFGADAGGVKTTQKAHDIVAEHSDSQYAHDKKVAKEFIADQVRKFMGLDVKTRQKTLLSGTATAGGNLVPDEFDRAMRSAPAPAYPIRNLVSRVQMATDKMNVPVQTGGPTVAWVGEESQISESTPTYGNVSLTAYKAASLVKSSYEFLGDESVVPSAIEKLYQDFVTNFAKHEQEFIIKGTGSSQPTGFTTEFKASGSEYDIVNAANTKDSITDANIRALLFTLAAEYRNDAVLIMNQAALTIVGGLDVGGSGSKKVFTSRYDTATPIPEGADGLVYNVPVFVTSDIGATHTIGGTIAASKASAIIYASMRDAYIVGDRSGSEIETGLDGNDFSHARISHRALRRYAGNLVKGLERKPAALLAWRATT